MQPEIAVLTVIPEELRWARQALDITDKGRSKKDGTIYWHGSVRSHISRRYYSIVLTCIGYAGNYDCAAATSDVINEYRPRVVLLTGIAAGLPAKVKIGEVVLSERVVAYEPAAINTREDGTEQIIPRPEMPRIEHGVEQDVVNYLASVNLGRVERKFRALKGAYPHPPEGKEKEYQNYVATEAKIKTATMASGEKLLRHTDKLYSWRKKLHGRIEVGEMEAAGLATACRRHNVPWLVIRGISDFGDEFKDESFHEFAAKIAAAAMRDFIAYGLDLGTKRSRFPQAYDQTAHGHMLSRERLSKQDFEQGNAVKPRRIDEIVQALKQKKSVAVQGPPGSGKSALAAWANWIVEENGQLFAAFLGRELQESDVRAMVARLEEVPSDHILVIDDIHLAEPVLVHLKSFPWSGERRFLLLGRAPYVERALRTGQVPRIDTKLVNITAQDSMYIAGKLARKYLGDDQATRLLHRTGGDLVLTKWLLEAVVLEHASPNSTPKDAAIAKLEALGEDWGHELVRLFLTLAAFGWVELWCPETFLVDILGFELETLKQLREPIHEAERQRRLGAQGGHALRLLRHPKLCELFLDAAPELGLVFDKQLFAPTCAAINLKSKSVKSYGFAPLILGAVLADEVVDLLSIEWRLVYGGRGSDYVNVVKAAAELSRARYQGSSTLDLPLDERQRRLLLAFAAANGERRLHGGQAGKALLEELLGQLRVIDIPAAPFVEKGYILYQDAYLMRLNNAGQSALDRFEESAIADETWDIAQNSLVHRGKAAMSRVAASGYRIDMAVFSGRTPGDLHPDRVQLKAVSRDLTVALTTLEGLLSSGIDEKGRQLIEGFRTNALLHLAEAAGWLGDETTVDRCLNALRPDVDYYKRRVIMGLARGALALTKGRHDQVILELEGQPEERVELGSGEGAGKTGVMLLLSYLRIGRRDRAEVMRCWLVSDQCPTDAGNGLAKSWAAQLKPIA